MAGISYLAWGKLAKLSLTGKVTPVENESQVNSEKDYDPLLLERFRKVSAKLDFSGNEFFMSGTISAENGADSTDKITKVIYILSKSGQNFYCRFGETETVNGNGVYAFVDHTLKKIMVSKQKEVIANAVLPDLAALVKNLKGEGYQLNNEKESGSERILIVNEYHISCKIYRLSFNPESLAPRQIYLRLSNMDDPGNKQKDKTITIDIKECAQKTDISTYAVDKIVKKNNTSWVQAPGYEGYELIVI